MRLAQLRVAVFDNATAATVQADVNSWARGLAVSASATFPAGFVADQQFVAAYAAGTRIVIFYVE